jgi:hypothetical protein
MIIALSAAFLAGSPPDWLRGVGAGAGAVVLVAGRLGVVWTLLGAGGAGALIALAGGPLP